VFFDSCYKILIFFYAVFTIRFLFGLKTLVFNFPVSDVTPAVLWVFTRRRSETADYFPFFVEFSSRQKTENHGIIVAMRLLYGFYTIAHSVERLQYAYISVCGAAKHGTWPHDVPG